MSEAEKVDEQLTEKERRWAEHVAPETHALAHYEAAVVAKLLRLHDRLKARVEELERARPPACCVTGQHSFSWRQGLAACRYCGECGQSEKGPG
jgi:hypothetical protein